MSSGFDEFTEAVSKSTTKKPVIESKSFSRIAVLGGGADARLIAALCLSEGAEVKLFSAYGEELSTLRSSSGVTLRGAGPVGTYHVDREDAQDTHRTTHHRNHNNHKHHDFEATRNPNWKSPVSTRNDDQ